MDCHEDTHPHTETVCCVSGSQCRRRRRDTKSPAGVADVIHIRSNGSGEHPWRSHVQANKSDECASGCQKISNLVWIIFNSLLWLAYYPLHYTSQVVNIETKRASSHALVRKTNISQYHFKNTNQPFDQPTQRYSSLPAPQHYLLATFPLLKITN